METQKIAKLLSNSGYEYPKFATKYGTLLAMVQKVFIHTKMQSNF